MSVTLLKNVAGQGVYLLVRDGAGNPLPGDAANITGFYSLDGGAEVTGFVTTHPTDIGHGMYFQPLAQAETDMTDAEYSWVSSTPGVLVDPVVSSTLGPVTHILTTAASAVNSGILDVCLADNVQHGGPPGLSAATAAFRTARINNGSGDGLVLSGTSRGLVVNGNGAVSAAMFAGPDAVLHLGGPNASVELWGGASTPAAAFYGPYTTIGPVVVIDATSSNPNTSVDGGPGIQINTGAGDAIQTNTTGGHGFNGTLAAAALASFFNTNSGTTFGASVAGSVVKEIADHAAPTDISSLATQVSLNGLITTVGVAGAGLTAVQLAAAGLNAIDIAGKSLPVAVRYVSAMLCGKVSGAGTGTEVFKDFADVTAVTVTDTAAGNRTAVVLS